MKIGIVTFWTSKDNFGQILQCYALQAQLKKMGHTPKLIRIGVQKTSPSFYIRIKIMLFEILRLNRLKYGGKNFEKFLKKYITYTNRIYYTKRDLTQSELDYDAIICGSDVVWSEGVGTGDYGELFFLDFFTHPIKKISYAASFGATDLSKSFADFAKVKISNFDAISVREKTGVKICSQLGRDDAVAVCDPTLLLKKEDYERLMPGIERKVCFGYFIGWPTDIPVGEIHSFASENRLKFSRLNCQTFKISLKNLFSHPKTISDWLSTYLSAACIFTNSFHGVIFAILFNKQFLFFPIKEPAARLNNRVENLLSQLNLMDRIWNSETSIKEQMNHKIDWERVNAIVEQLRNNSIKWLKNSLEISNNINN